MAHFSHQLQEIKTLLLPPSSDPNRTSAYSILLHLQQQSALDSSLIQTLRESSPTLLSSILQDVLDDDEEIAASALKCLGFMIYHPVLVAAVSEDRANAILNSLARVIMTTKMKSVCNLGVWCISVQQFNALFLAANFHSLLRSIIHALDNPVGSLSTTFEAIQAVMKLASQLSEKMRETSDIWAPPIYRRLVSVDKKERDMSERCLSKIGSTVLPPSLSLSKAVLLDIKQRLLVGLSELVNHGMKVQAVQAWGWLLRLLGSYALKNRQLVNDLLKIPEQTFSDHDPQVQIASQVAWEGLIDALFPSSIRVPKGDAVLEHGIPPLATSEGCSNDIHINRLLKVTKLIMTPLIGIISSKCDLSVRSSCLNTWCYLLHKLDAFVNNPLVMETVMEPILEAVFGMGPGSKNIWLWNHCLVLLDDCIKAKWDDLDMNNQGSRHMSARTAELGSPLSDCSWKPYPIKWMPWELSRLDFHLKMVSTFINQGSMEIVSPQKRSLTCDAALRIFKSVLRAVKSELENPATNYNKIMLCLNTILRFLKRICEDETLGDCGFHYTSIQFVEAITEELEPSILGSSLYNVALDLKYIDNMLSVMEVGRAKILGIGIIVHMDMVSPIVYLTALYFCLLVKSLISSKVHFILQGLHRYIEFLVSSYDSLEHFRVFIVLMYEIMDYRLLEIWMVVVKALKACIDDGKYLTKLKLKSDSINQVAVCSLLAYPFVVFSCPQEELASAKATLPLPSTPNKLKVENIIRVWKSLYQSVNCASQLVSSPRNSFSEDLCSLLNLSLDGKTIMIECGTGSSTNIQELDALSLLGDAVICVLDQLLIMKVSLGENKTGSNGGSQIPVDMKSSLGFAARFMYLSSKNRRADSPTGLAVTARVFASLAGLVRCLCLRHDIISFIEILSSPLLTWVSLLVENHDESTLPQLQLLWTGTLECLQRSWPPIHFDSSFLKLQAPLLEITLNHPKPSISEPTIDFWNSTYGEQTNLNFPQNMIHVLDKLFRSGKLNLYKRSPSFLRKCRSRPEASIAPQRHSVAATRDRSSKGAELVRDTPHGVEPKDAGSKRKRRELTERQKKERQGEGL